MLANLRRKMGLVPLSQGNDPSMMVPPFMDPALVQAPPFTMEELGGANGGPWTHDGRMFSPSAIPLWLQEQNLNDLGLPINGSDGIFLQMANTNGWTGDFPPMPEAW